MIEELKKELEEEKIRHEKTVKELEEKIKKLEETKKEEQINNHSENEETQKVYFVPENRETKEIEENILIDNSTMQTVYLPPRRAAEKKKKQLGFFGFIKQLFKRESIESKKETSDIVYIVPKAPKEEKPSNDIGPVYMVPKRDEEYKKEENTYEYNDIIEYAKRIKKDKENHKLLQTQYTEALKTNNKEQVAKIKNMLWESQNKITLSESFLRNRLKEIRKSPLSIEEKTKLTNYICGIAKIKAKEKPAHMKEETTKEENTKSPEDELNERKEKIISSKHFTDVQKKNMIREIDDELIELAKKDETKSKTM